MQWSWISVAACVAVACGASASHTASPAPPAPPASSEPAEPQSAPAPPSAPEQVAEAAAAPVPEACAPGQAESDCTPPAAWVDKLCNGVYAEVALVMFRGGSPWQRRYLRGKTRAVNASGGVSVEGFLSRDEEVLVLRHRGGDASGIQIGDGSGRYDVLRWDGSCASLEGGELTARRPRAPRQARIEWRWLGDRMRAALRRDTGVDETFRQRKRECRGATTGIVSKACERLDTKLIERIAAYVRTGPELPQPEDHP